MAHVSSGAEPNRLVYITPRDVMVKCGRCQGSGTLQYYRHVQNGVCFACEGEGVDSYLTVFDVEYLADEDGVRGLAAFEEHLAGDHGDDLLGWLLSGPPCPPMLTASGLT